MSKVLVDPSEPVLKSYLIIATSAMKRNLFVQPGCMLEVLLLVLIAEMFEAYFL